MGAVQITRLREATAADHEAVEGSVPLLRSDLSPAMYQAFLERMYGVVSPWERWLAEAAPAWMQELVKARQREGLLVGDLRAMGTTPELLPLAVMPETRGTSELLGAMYVMEGSRLGGQLLARHAEKLLGEAGRRSSGYLRGFGEATGAMWKQFVGVVEAEIPDEEAEQAIVSARRMFRVFGDWMRGLEFPDSRLSEGRWPVTKEAGAE